MASSGAAIVQGYVDIRLNLPNIKKELSKAVEKSDAKGAGSKAAKQLAEGFASAANKEFSNFKDSISDVGAAVLAEIGTSIAPLLRDMTGLARELGDVLKALARDIGAWLEGPINALREHPALLKAITIAIVGMVAAYKGTVGLLKVFAALRAAISLVKAVQLGWTVASYGAAAASYASKDAALALAAAQKVGAFANKVATATQWLLTRAMNASPITKIIVLVSLLVGALVWFFTQTEVGKQMWASFTRFLGEAWANISAFFQTVWDSVLKPVIDGLGAAFTWLWETILKPVFDGIAAVLNWVWLNIMQPTFLAIQFAVAILGGIFVGLYEVFLKPVFDAIGAVFTWLYENVIALIILGIQVYVQIWAAVFTWLWETILKPTFDGIAAVFTWIYENIIVPIILGIQLYIQAWAAVFTWLYEFVLKPTFEEIAAAFIWVWETVLQPVFNALLAGWNAVWEGIRAVIDFVWSNGIRPIIDTLVSVIQTDPQKAFEAARDAIGTAWKGIQDLAKKPVDFVVGTVINGMIDTINQIPGVSIPKVPWPPNGWYDGGYTGNIGATRIAGVVHGNEHVIRAASRAKIESRHPGLLDHMNRYGAIPGYRRGGLVNPLPRGSYTVSQLYSSRHNGIDLAAPMGTKIMAAADGIATNVGVVYLGGNEIRLQHPSGYATRYSHLSSFAISRGATVRQGQTIGRVGSTGMSTGPHLHYMVHTPPGGWSNMTNPASYLDSFSNGWNPLTGLLEWAVSKFTAAFPGGGMWIEAAGGLLKETVNNAVAWAAKQFGMDATGATLYDNGGWLEPGLSLVQNRTGRPEPILTGAQWAQLRQAGEAPRMPRELIVKDIDGNLVGRMRVEAADVVADALTPASAGNVMNVMGVR